VFGYLLINFTSLDLVFWWIAHRSLADVLNFDNDPVVFETYEMHLFHSMNPLFGFGGYLQGFECIPSPS